MQKLQPVSVIKPSEDFLNCLESEYDRKVYGTCTEEMLKDYLTVVQ